MNPAGIFIEARANGLPFWDSEAEEELCCVGIRDETDDVRTFMFTAQRPSRFFYWPGQFLTFDFLIDGARVNRCYTIAATPTRPHQITITVKRKPGGVVSPWLHATMRPGSRVRAVGPLGDFSFVAHPAEKYLFLSGGSGITPLMSMARAHHDLGHDADILFVHFARSPADIIFRRELDLMAHHMPRLRVVQVCETDSPHERWGGMRGRVNAPMLALIAPDLMDREVFDCGPEPFMRAVRGGLDALGFDMSRYHEESFDFGTLAEAEPAVAAASMAAVADAATGAAFSVEFIKSRRTIRVPADRHVLEAARLEGLRLPSSCTKGLCGTCKSRLISGKVEMHHQGGIRQREIDQGMILICCSKPLTDLVIER
ncbi:hybrid-cluster NAD(P)-dependent oxidoreductase [Acidiphilium sp. AL]|uniref:Hybrid-cluster NAD(P)-dependent oxidoreductase n=1 Tax=Acidiphilium iwatense TaxID=768198 RepID=A0ABS9DY81_9PROT|nr:MULTISPECIES: hybrid-cluster NAD(P)-dependent oxidoreductase [Acidiphilium]MCF3947701.1 hybrid-cluster NAD(P)-dependent oxidoreductase [Acidiphilium iwatense]MCU4161077.1 hybrid-cluster NAD(P)-dependent oxidoreductase [Acidiphilium sp. AL]